MAQREAQRFAAESRLTRRSPPTRASFGEASISRDPALLQTFAVQGKMPRTVLVVKVKEAYIHCSRALVRASLWDPAKFAAPGAVPSFGTIMAAHTRGFVNAQALDEEAKVRVPLTLY